MFVIPRPGCFELWWGSQGKKQGAVAVDNGI